MLHRAVLRAVSRELCTVKRKFFGSEKFIIFFPNNWNGAKKCKWKIDGQWTDGIGEDVVSKPSEESLVLTHGCCLHEV